MEPGKLPATERAITKAIQTSTRRKVLLRQTRPQGTGKSLRLFRQTTVATRFLPAMGKLEARTKTLRHKEIQRTRTQRVIAAQNQAPVAPQAFKETHDSAAAIWAKAGKATDQIRAQEQPAQQRPASVAPPVEIPLAQIQNSVPPQLAAVPHIHAAVRKDKTETAEAIATVAIEAAEVAAAAGGKG